MSVALDVVALTTSLPELRTNFIYLGDYTVVGYFTVGSGGVELTINFPTLELSTTEGVVDLDTVPLTLNIVSIEVYARADACELINVLSTMKLGGSAPSVSGDPACELSSILNNMRIGVTHTPVGDSTCDMSNLLECLIAGGTIPGVPGSEVTHYGAGNVALSFASGSGSAYVNIAAYSYRILLVHIVHRTATPVTAVTHDSVPMTKLLSVADGSGVLTADIWYLVNANEGNLLAVVTIPGNTQWVACRFLQFYGVNQATPFGTYTSQGVVAAIFSTVIECLTGEFPMDFIGFTSVSGATNPSEPSQSVIVGGVLGSLESHISHRNLETGDLTFGWEVGIPGVPPGDFGVAHIALTLTPYYEVPEVDLSDFLTPTSDGCELSEVITSL